MGIYTTLPEDVKEVDIIIAGGGTAGCVVASRLAAASPCLHILVIETGANNWQDPKIVNPVFFFDHLRPDSERMIFYPSKPSEHLNGRSCIIPGGSCLGGSSSVNSMTYSRPQGSDFDSWGIPGWDSDNMLRVMRKFETYHGHDSSDVHGTAGPINVSDSTYRGASEDDFIAAAEKAGLPEADDIQNLDTVNFSSRAKRYISPEGIRQDTAHRYLHPLLRDGKHPNLYVVTESHVERILLEDGRATSVEYTPKHPSPANNSAPSSRTISARKMIIASCGTLGTPLLLQRSGIGPPSVLAKADIPVLVPNEHVGNHYQDHPLMVYTYQTSLPPDATLNPLLFGKISASELLESKSPLLGYNAQDVTAKLRPSDAEVRQLSPDFQAAWRAHFADTPDKPLVGIASVGGVPGLLPPPDTPYASYLGMTAFSTYPFSRGSIHLAARPHTRPHTRPENPPFDFHTGFLADPRALDIQAHIWAYKRTRELMRRLACYRGEAPAWHPRFRACSSAACVALAAPLAPPVADLVYTAADDGAIEAHVRAALQTCWHGLGTCRVGARGDGVVDARLGVWGVRGLMVVDLSVCRENVGCNTYSAAVAVGERAAELLGESLGVRV